jgi:hypothetical protein
MYVCIYIYGVDVVEGAGRKAKRMVLQCINGVGSNPVVEWSRAMDVWLSEWGCSVSMVWVQIPSREEQKFDIYL